MFKNRERLDRHNDGEQQQVRHDRDAGSHRTFLIEGSTIPTGLPYLPPEE
jgi:hypothetical protein